MFFAFIGGLITGSFLNVIIYRQPREISIIKPRSYCPHCNTPIPFYRNIPLISFILQAGKCNECRKVISWKYPFVELLTGFFWGLAFYLYPLHEAVLFIWMTGFLTAIAFIDSETQQIPLILMISAFSGLVIFTSLHLDTLTFSFFGMLSGTSYLGIILGITWLLFKKQTMGFGDLILVGILGIWLGPLNILLTIFLAAILALSAYLFISLKNGFDRNLPLPFGAYIATGSIIIKIIEPDLLSIFFS